MNLRVFLLTALFVSCANCFILHKVPESFPNKSLELHHNSQEQKSSTKAEDDDTNNSSKNVQSQAAVTEILNKVEVTTPFDDEEFDSG